MTRKIPHSKADQWMTDVLVRIASGGQPYSRSNSDGVAMYYLQQWGFVRTETGPTSGKSQAQDTST